MVDFKASGKKIGSNAGKKAVKTLGTKTLAKAQGAVASKLGGLAGSMLGKVGNALLGNEYPEVAFRFGVEIEGLVQALFTEISGLEWEVSTESFHEGGLNFHERTLLGPGKFSKLTLKRGFTGAGSEFLLWLKGTYGNQAVKRRNVSIIIFNQEQSEVGRFNLKNAAIVKYTGPSFNSDNSAVAFESVEIVYDYFEYQPAGLTETLAGSLASAGINAAAGLIK